MRVDYTLREIGDACRQFRKRQGYTQVHIAIDTGYTPSNVSHFENGANDNIKLLMWYIDHGFSLDFLDNYVRMLRGL